MEYVTIMEAARRIRVSDKTIQRAIRRGTLLAYYPQPNRCEIAVSDLESFRAPGQVSGQTSAPLETRVAELQQRVQELEQQIQLLLGRQETAKPPRLPRTKERTTGPLPKHLVALLPFAGHHNVAERTVLAAINMGLLTVKRGEWTDTDGTIIKEALDTKGRHAFYRIYHDVPPFVTCKLCPHQTT